MFCLANPQKAFSEQNNALQNKDLVWRIQLILILGVVIRGIFNLINFCIPEVFKLNV
jgi:hypothetical protein